MNIETASAYELYIHALDVIRTRWLEAEETIIKDARLAHNYALNIIHGRWLEAEETISKSAHYAARYAAEVLEAPWPEVEYIISQDPYLSKEYCKCVYQDEDYVTKNEIPEEYWCKLAKGYLAPRKWFEFVQIGMIDCLIPN